MQIRLRKRITRALPGWAYLLLQQRPHVTTYGRYMRRLDEIETAAWIRGNRAARDEAERLDEAADRAIASYRARIDAGPARPRRSAVRVTSTGAALRAVSGGAA